MLFQSIRDAPLENLWGGGGVVGLAKYKTNIRARESNSCTPINPKKYSCYDLKKIHTSNLMTKKNSCGSKIPHPPPAPHNFSNGLSLKQYLLVSTSFFQFYSLTQLLPLKAWFPYHRYNRCDRWQKKKFSDRNHHSDNMETSLPAIAATTITKIELFISAIAGKCFPYNRYDRCDRWTFYSQQSQPPPQQS